METSASFEARYAPSLYPTEAGCWVIGAGDWGKADRQRAALVIVAFSSPLTAYCLLPSVLPQPLVPSTQSLLFCPLLTAYCSSLAPIGKACKRR